MAPTPAPPESGGDDHISEVQQGLRLSDAERIAARRRNGVAGGSLEEALAVAPAGGAGTAGPQLADRIGAAGESFAAGPLVRLIDARFAEMGRTQMREPPYAFSSMPRPPMLELGIALVRQVDSIAPPTFAGPEIAAGDEPTRTPTEDWQGFVDDTPPASATAPLAHAAATRSMQPLASALDAAARLAVDASVAAEALENLKRMLEHKQQLESQLPQLAAGPAPVPAADYAQASAPVAPATPALPPLPLPLHAEPDAGRRSAVLPPPRRQRPLPERRGFDVRGFLAGFALSWAFGAVLYLFMTAG